jgi:predicted nucleotidyltransferase
MNSSKHGIIRQYFRQMRFILDLAGVGEVYLFGSMARGEADRSSDVDLLLNDISGLSSEKLSLAKNRLERLLGRKVDFVPLRGLPPHIRDTILQERVPLLWDDDENLSQL